MSYFNVSNTYDYMNSFFGNNSTNSSSGSTNFLGDYYAIQNGSYYKLAKNYYAKAAKEDESSAKASKQSVELVKSGAQETMDSLSKLMDDSLFKQVETKDQDGNKVTGYDKDKILDKLKEFVENYNSMVKDAGEMDGDNSLRAGVRLVDQMKVYKSALSKIGVSIEGDNTLKIDEEAFKEANMTDTKSLFTGSVSMAKNIQTKLMQVYSAANTDLNSIDGLYSSQAVKSLSTGSMFDSLL